MVDTVLYLEGERYFSYRILRGVKNRFGSTNEIGMFEMQNEGLVEIVDPSSVLISEREEGTTGSVIVASLEGTRPILLELQALATPTVFGLLVQEMQQVMQQEEQQVELIITVWFY